MALQHHDRILVFLRWGIGDVILEWPTLAALRRARPDAHLTLLGARPAVQLLEGSGLADDVRSYQEFGMTHVGDADEEAGARLDAWLASRSFEAVADVLTAPPAARRVAWRRGAWHYETDQRATSAALRSGADAAGALLAGAAAGWGLAGVDGAVEPALSLDDRREAAQRVLDGFGLPPEDVVAVVPFASDPLKRWPVESFVALAEALVRDGRRILLFAAPDDDSAVTVARRSAAPGEIRVVPPLHLRTTAALLALAAVAVGNDTGLLHIAAAAGTPAISIFGPTDARVYAPAGYASLAATARLPCEHRQDRSLSPPGCWTSERCLIRDHSCVEEIPVETVLRRVRGVLGPAGAARSAVTTPP